jgi:anti-sigma factor ChrR (cupin superfamily)
MATELAHDQDSLAAGPTIDVHSDLTRRVVVQSEAVPWSPSPWIPGINRKFLDRYGNGQFVPSTSIVSFGTGVRDPYHAHPHGEEFYVLDGVLSDHTGDYLPGFYVRHPIRWCHAPYVDMRNSAAVVWVKVSQILDENEPIIVKDTCDLDLPEWLDGECAEGRVRILPLHQNARSGERVWIETFEPGTRTITAQPPGGEEVFVIAGTLTENRLAHYATHTWIRNPISTVGAQRERVAPRGCKLLVKSGHLPIVTELYARAKSGAFFSSNPRQYRQDQRIHGDVHGIDEARRAREQRDGQRRTD